MEKVSVSDSIERPATDMECPSQKATLFDYFFDIKRRVWIAYDWIVPEYVHQSNLEHNEIFVPTADTMRINHILNQLANVHIESMRHKKTIHEHNILNRID